MAKIIQQSARRPHTPHGSFVESLERDLKFYTKWSVAMCSRLNQASPQLSLTLQMFSKRQLLSALTHREEL